MNPEEREEVGCRWHAEVFHSVPAPSAKGLGTTEERVAPGCFDAHQRALLASDPKSGELGGAIRICKAGVDEALADPFFDAAKISVPTLVIRGDADTWATREDNQQLINALGTVKSYVEIPNVEGIFCSSRTSICNFTKRSRSSWKERTRQRHDRILLRG